jgi:hypothetical protein
VADPLPSIHINQVLAAACFSFGIEAALTGDIDAYLSFTGCALVAFGNDPRLPVIGNREITSNGYLYQGLDLL